MDETRHEQVMDELATIGKRIDGIYAKHAHRLKYGSRGVFRNYPDVAICECGAQSEPLRTVVERREWHRKHKVGENNPIAKVIR